MKASPLVIGIVLAIIVVAFTSSPPAALSIALPMVAAAYSWTANPILNPNALARCAAIAAVSYTHLYDAEGNDPFPIHINFLYPSRIGNPVSIVQIPENPWNPLTGGSLTIIEQQTDADKK